MNFINCLKVFYVIFAFVFHMYSTVMHINVLFLLISLTDITLFKCNELDVFIGEDV